MKLGDLEARYSTARRSVTEVNAMERGFVKATDKTYVRKSASAMALLGR
jgi:hypothetical protein